MPPEDYHETSKEEYLSMIDTYHFGRETHSIKSRLHSNVIQLKLPVELNSLTDRLLFRGYKIDLANHSLTDEKLTYTISYQYRCIIKVTLEILPGDNINPEYHTSVSLIDESTDEGNRYTETVSYWEATTGLVDSLVRRVIDAIEYAEDLMFCVKS